MHLFRKRITSDLVVLKYIDPTHASKGYVVADLTLCDWDGWSVRKWATDCLFEPGAVVSLSRSLALSLSLSLPPSLPPSLARSLALSLSLARSVSHSHSLTGTPPLFDPPTSPPCRCEPGACLGRTHSLRLGSSLFFCLGSSQHSLLTPGLQPSA